jgi:hypothetical protein
MSKYIQSTKGYFYKIGNNGLKKRISKEEFYKKKKFVGGNNINIVDVVSKITTLKTDLETIKKECNIPEEHRVEFYEVVKNIILSKQLPYYFFKGFTIDNFISLNIKVEELQEVGFNKSQLKKSGYLTILNKLPTKENFNRNGITLESLLSTGSTLSQLYKNGYTKKNFNRVALGLYGNATLLNKITEENLEKIGYSNLEIKEMKNKKVKK